MKMVSAAKLRKAQQAITQMRPYVTRLNKILKNILSSMEGDATTSYGVAREEVYPVIVTVTSNRGLCGAFNTNVIKEAIQVVETRFKSQYEAGNLTVLPIGKKGYDTMKKKYPKANIIADYVTIFNDLSFDNVAVVSQMLMDGFKSGEYDVIVSCYGRFKNAAMQFSEADQFLPVEKLEKSSEESKIKADYIFEPDKETLLESLIPSILQTKFQKYLLDTHASEHGARMTAMDKATENASDLIKDLKIKYNKARQESITSELSEIVGGAAALESA
ncbi:UNVERIFIED_CONTAM: hypothetical protein GTU68_007526 [Idotea baltica]|nr:hypothetical protein [Idotea baltica]